MGRRALITGITGQDGSILATLLSEKNYDVHGMREYSAVPDLDRLPTSSDITLHYGDMTDGSSLARVLDAVAPDEIYNLAAMSHVHVSFVLPEHTAQVNALGTLRLLEAIRAAKMEKRVRYYQASSSEMFGRAAAPQSEVTPFEPCSPYATAKLYAYWTVRNYREAYGLHASNGILFNHESTARGQEFVTRKITRAVGAIEAGDKATLRLGNLDARRDWGHARDYMEGAYLMLQQEAPDDYVLATGKAHSVREFLECAFACVGIGLAWEGNGTSEIGRDTLSGRVLVEVDETLFRPQEIHELVGNADYARKKLGWSPRVSFEKLVEEMVMADRRVQTAPVKIYAT
jgi:GDPmannose 4,6-dehydratase